MIIASALPSKVITNEELQKEFTEYNVLRLGRKIGIEKRNVLSVDESALDLAVEACEKLFKTVKKEEVDFVLYCTQSPEKPLPTTACLLHKRLGLKSSVGALDFNLGCSGYVYGLAMAKGIVSSGIASSVLLITAESYSKYLGDSDVINKAIFGDGATATFLDKEIVDKMGEFSLGSDGNGAENLIVPEIGGDFYMNGPEVFKFTLNSVPQSINDCLEKNNLNLENIDMFILHQANEYMLNNLRKKIGAEKEKFFIDVKEIGNTVSNTIPIALESCIKEGLIKGGSMVLLCGFGVGYSWGTTIIRF